MIDNKVGKITKKEIMELCPDIRKYLHHFAQKSWCCGEYVYSTFFMLCHSCACLMGNSELLCMWSGWIVPLYREKSERRRESKHCGLYGLHFVSDCMHYGAWAAHLNKKVTTKRI